MDFYLHLESNACVQEFPRNSQHNFKNRLSYPIYMKERGWRVGLANVSYALSRLRRFSYDKFGEEGKHIFWGGISMEITFNNQSDIEKITLSNSIYLTWTRFVEMGRTFQSGVELMKFLVDYYGGFISETKRHGADFMIKKYDKRADDPHELDFDKVLLEGRGYITLKWEEDDLIIDNTHTWREDKNVFGNAMNARPSIRFGTELALAMDWIRYDALNDEYLLQHNNLQMMSLEKPAERPQDYQGKYWKVEVEFLYLSVFADWKFTNLNFLSENMIGWNIPHKHGIERKLRFESNVAASTIVGNQITHVLREIQYVPSTKYYKPSHIQYIPVRQQFCDIIKVDLREENGEHATFETGKTTVTLHFKQYDH